MRNSTGLLKAIFQAAMPQLHREIAEAFSPLAPLGETNSRAPMNRAADLQSARIYALVFEGVTRVSSASTEHRAAIAAAVYDTLRTGGVQFRCEDGLARLRAVAKRLDGGADTRG